MLFIELHQDPISNITINQPTNQYQHIFYTFLPIVPNFLVRDIFARFHRLHLTLWLSLIDIFQYITRKNSQRNCKFVSVTKKEQRCIFRARDTIFYVMYVIVSTQFRGGCEAVLVDGSKMARRVKIPLIDKYDIFCE